MENENSELVEQTPPDFTNLEQSITELVEVIQTEQEIKAEEKALEEEKAVEESVQAETDYQNMQTVYQTSSESQTLAIEGLQAEMATMNSNMEAMTVAFGEMNETMLKQNDLIVEGSFTITLAIAIVVSIKVFIDQISKW